MIVQCGAMFLLSPLLLLMLQFRVRLASGIALAEQVALEVRQQQAAILAARDTQLATRERSMYDAMRAQAAAGACFVLGDLQSP